MTTATPTKRPSCGAGQSPTTAATTPTRPTTACSIELPLPQTRLKHLVTHATGKALRSALAAYEATGDHNHGNGPIHAGAACGSGGDCWVKRARVTLAVIEALHSNH